ncbi:MULTISPECIES: formate dehydrogenase subunit gamma [Pseudomonas]|jgi:formate dehydrogenase subunit gamma|uniref:Formate dehydrogenase, nitrate-inducible, cytochrome b556(Fdn) subunit FdnI n=2 Tax=Pseudomonas TaxID=286 RepID=A0A2C9EN13_PSEPH|nr:MULTISPECIES: formate dehydrogenase subunit gamma [Pseudomonas]GED73532.1 formate dehydrogenase cytochrome b556 subunit [Pseudomonas fluorescens]AGL85037.1 formate dehydrogenase, nitrate-inducible, cytochrome b556(fdn) subunit FdnI [Pseudomonas protegens CHA0]AQT10117.1 formate dehydrogenase subunit gamma [Pseudomonas protegens]MBB1612619.1 formate dehydrogenase subunit gamma [Pseudomonas sp. UMC65]MBB1622867.1 formate dehydrogenase subunit gamma [Pseudomonas sp. UME65]
MNKNKLILRTRFIERASHWFMVICFFMVALSGLSWFFPSLNWLNGVFGTPQLARILHPFLGTVVFLLLMFLFVRFVKHNLPERQDAIWFRNLKTVLSGDHSQPLQIGKYNAGQKILFWGIMGLISLLLLSGVVIWRPWFAQYFSIPLIRIALLTHALAGISLMLLIIGHAYLAFWVKGSIRGMVTGYVSRSWARSHHDRWYQQISKSEKK